MWRFSWPFQTMSGPSSGLALTDFVSGIGTFNVYMHINIYIYIYVHRHKHVELDVCNVL